MRQSIALQSSARVWVVVMGGRRGRPEIVAGRLMTRPRRCGSPPTSPRRTRRAGSATSLPRVCWLCGGTVERQAVRS